MKVAVVGGGAAGFFAAASVKHHHPDAEVVLLEKSTKTLSKVKVSGGGRCNVTHDQRNLKPLIASYPRGRSILKKVLPQFSVPDTIKWFEDRGVRLITEDDGRMFPDTNRSQTIIDALRNELIAKEVEVLTMSPVQRLIKHQKGWTLELREGTQRYADKVIVASGGSPKREGLSWLEDLGHEIVPPVPSLFTFNITDANLRTLSGLSVPNAKVWIEGEKKESEDGPLLITHWGLSGPAILRLSAFKARELAACNYQFPLKVQWVSGMEEQHIQALSEWQAAQRSKKLIINLNPTELPQRLWEFLLQCAEVPANARWIDLSKKLKHRLLEALTNHSFVVEGKTTFKEEFVTAGGVSAKSVEPRTMESRHQKGLYFSGEILDIDGVTGGFNFQAAWSTGWVAGKLISI